MASKKMINYEGQAPCASLMKVAEGERATRLGLGGCNQRRPVRMVRRVEAGQSSAQAGRMLLSGSIDDICAQIDRLIAMAAFKP